MDDSSDDDASSGVSSSDYNMEDVPRIGINLKGTDHVGTFMGLKCVIYYANYRSGNQSSKIQVVP